MTIELDFEQVDLVALARRCETASADEWAVVVHQVTELTEPLLASLHGQQWLARRKLALSYAAVGAIESAVLVLLPSSIDLTGGTTKGRTAVVAQAFVHGIGAAHTRRATSLAMGWLSAYLHALANGVAGRVAATELVA